MARVNDMVSEGETMLKWALMGALALGASACDDGGEGGEGGAPGEGGMGGMAMGGAGGDGEGRRVPYEGDLPALPANTAIELADHFPLVEGGVWRYRRRAEDPFNPGPVEQGGETSIQSVMALEDGKQEIVRRTVTIIDLDIDGEMKRVRQVIDETFVRTPEFMLVGPKIEYKRLRIEERVVEDQAFVRVLDREYLPPYIFIEDTWKVGLVQTNIQTSDIRLIQSLTLAGDEEPRETEGLVTVRVDVDPVGEGNGAVEPIEGAYREDLREIMVYDDFQSVIQRRYWVQPGVGQVKWQFASTNNIQFTLTETNLEEEEPQEEQAAE